MPWSPPDTDTVLDRPAASGWTPPDDDPVVSDIGKAESFGRAVANNLPLVPQVIAGAVEPLAAKLMPVKNKGYSENLADWNAKAAAAKKANPVSYGAGAVTGAVGTGLIPGVGEAMEAAPILSSAALGGANALSNEDLTKDQEELLKKFIAGSVVGGGVGAAGKLVGSVLSKAPPIGERMEANATAQALDLGTFGVKKLARGENPEKVLNEINKDLNELLPGTIGTMDTATSKFQKLATAHDQAGSMIGSVVDSVTKGTGTNLPEAQEAIDELTKAAEGYKGLTSQRALDAKAELQDAVTRINGLKASDQLTFKNLAAIKSEIGSAYHNPNFQNHGVDQAYGILSDKIDKLLDRVSPENPTAKPLYEKARDIYRLTSKLLPAMQRGASKEVAGVGGGLTNAALGTATLMGHPAAGAALVGKSAAKLAAPDLLPNLSYKAVNALRNNPVLPALKQGIEPGLIDAAVSEYLKKNRP